MDTPEFKDFAHSMIDFIGDYLDNIRDRWDHINLHESGKLCASKILN